MKKILVFLLVLIPVFLIIFANIAYSVPPGGEPQALPTFIPVFSFHPLETEVAIPDAALRQRLHAATGVPDSDPIYSSQLAALTGNLFLDNYGIANAEGLQYCKNVEFISLTNNSLTTMPNCSGMTGLKWLNLNYNSFTSVPSGLFDAPHIEKLEMRGNPVADIDTYIADMTHLKELDLTDTNLHTFPYVILNMNIEVLRLDNTPINAVPNDINSMTHLKELYVGNAELEALPPVIYTMNNLEILEAWDNGIESISPNISGMTGLKQLSLGHNKLESLPDSICSLTNLEHLNVSYNSIYSLPNHIGDHLFTLGARANRLTSIPDSVIHSSTMYVLDVSVNRLTSLPSDFDETTAFDIITLDFNFLDVSSGSHDRELINDNPSYEINYQRQLKPVTGITVTPSPDSVTLSWNACENGSGDSATWTVKKYVVYQYTGEMVKLEELEPDQLSYTHTGLTPETEYSYRIGVDYRVVDPAHEDDLTTRGYTQADATTLADSAAVTSPPGSPVVSAEVSPEVSAEVSAVAESSSPDETDEAAVADAGKQDTALPVWAIIIAAVGALGIIGTGAALIVLKLRKPKE